MKKSRVHLLSYIAALVIGAILLATFWKWMFGAASSSVVTSAIAGAAVAVWCGMNSKSQRMVVNSSV